MIEDVIHEMRGNGSGEQKFQAMRSDGSRVVIRRSEIVLEEEEQLVKELAWILRQYQSPARHERYAVIMRQLIRKGVPFDSLLKKHMAAFQQQTLELSDVG